MRNDPRKEPLLVALDGAWESFAKECGVDFVFGPSSAWCPLHEERRSPSFSVFDNKDSGHKWWKCHSSAGCGSGNLIDLYMRVRKIDFDRALDELCDRFGIKGPPKRPARPVRSGPPTATYVYEDHERQPRMRVLRFDDPGGGKRFVQQRPDEGGGWISGVKGVDLIPFKLPDWMDREFVVLVEGEKCALALWSLGVPATTTPAGAGNWREEYAHWFTGKRVLIIPDNDAPGRGYGIAAGRDIVKVAAEVRWLDLPDLGPKEDVADWIARGGTVQQLKALVKDLPKWTPPPPEPARNGSAHAQPAGPDEDDEPEEREIVTERVKRYTAAHGVDPFSLVPQGTFLSSYVAYASKYTDAPEIFHVACGYTILGAALGRQVVWPVWGGVYPNFYTVLVGPSTTSRKSTAIRLAKGVLQHAFPSRIWPEEFSYEGLIEVMKQTPVGILLYSELASLLAIFGRSYSEGAKSLFVNLFDSPDKLERRLRTETIQIEGICASILAGSAESWLETSLGQTGIAGGFLSRLFIFLTSPDDKTRWMGFPPDPDPWEQEDLGEHLRRLAENAGKFHLSADAKEKWEDWLKSYERDLDESSDREVIGSAFGRLAVYALKVAGLNALASRQAMLVETEDVALACRLVDIVKANIVEFVRRLSTTKESREIKRAIEIIGDQPGISRRDLMRALSMRAKDVEEVLRTLQMRGEIECVRGRRKDQFHFFPVKEGRRGQARFRFATDDVARPEEERLS